MYVELSSPVVLAINWGSLMKQGEKKEIVENSSVKALMQGEGG